MLPYFSQLPANMQNKQVLFYYCLLDKKQRYLQQKQLFDRTAAVLLLIILAPLIGVLGIYVKIDSPGPVFFRQKRVTQCGREFFICKFRTMTQTLGAKLTARQDSRITKAGAFLRKYRLDEIPQLWNIAKGEMSFVGARPEVPDFVMRYTDEMRATLLLPAGLTSRTSILFRDEERFLTAQNVEEQYVQQLLPIKMRYNLNYLKNISWKEDIAVLWETVFSVFCSRPNDEPL